MFSCDFCEIFKNTFFIEHSDGSCFSIKKQIIRKNVPWHIFGALRDLVPFVQFKNVKNTHGGVLILVKLQASHIFGRTLNTPLKNLHKPWWHYGKDCIENRVFRYTSNRYHQEIFFKLVSNKSNSLISLIALFHAQIINVIPGLTNQDWVYPWPRP